MRAEIIRRYEAGEHLRQIGDAVGRSHERVRQILLSAGVTLRPRSHRGRRSSRTALVAEILEDLTAEFPDGASLSQLAEWFGGERSALLSAIRLLIKEDELGVTINWRKEV